MLIKQGPEYKPSEKGSIYQWLQRVFFVLYMWITVPVYVTEISQSVVTIGKVLTFIIYLLPKREKEGALEGNQTTENLSMLPHFCLDKGSY